MKRFWSDFEIKTVKRLANIGYSAAQIGDHIGRTRQSIIGVCQRKGIQLKGGGSLPALPTARHHDTPTPPRSKAPPILRVINNDAKIIADYVKRKGVRRYERGASTDYMALREFLKPHGWDLKLIKNTPWLGRIGGKSRRVDWQDVYSVVDKHRLAQGLEPILRTSSKFNRRKDGNG